VESSSTGDSRVIRASGTPSKLLHDSAACYCGKGVRMSSQGRLDDGQLAEGSTVFWHVSTHNQG